MYLVSKRMEVAGAHRLRLPYESKCENLHGHNWIITVHCCSEVLTTYGMVVDFKKIKDKICGQLDHKDIGSVLPDDMNPTAENIAWWVAMEANSICSDGFCYKVTVQESEGNIATYIDPKWATLVGRAMLVDIKEALK